MEKKAMILVIDDEQAIRKLFLRFLEDAGYEVLLASNGQEGVGIVEENREQIDLIILDREMPGSRDGLKALEKIRALDQNIKVLICSGSFSPEETEELEELGVDGMISKPCPKKELVNEIERILQS